MRAAVRFSISMSIGIARKINLFGSLNVERDVEE